jgi:hypothetical protein
MEDDCFLRTLKFEMSCCSLRGASSSCLDLKRLIGYSLYKRGKNIGRGFRKGRQKIDRKRQKWVLLLKK